VTATVVLDSSVLLKWFRQGEELADRALSVREAFLDGELEVAVPWLAVYEVANVLRFKRDLTSAQVQDAVQALLDMGLSWVAPSPALMRRAVALAHEADITVYDAAFVALAEGLEATFVTADGRLVDRLGNRGRARLLGSL
jgi:predicted nucleic acid-binding protein